MLCIQQHNATVTDLALTRPSQWYELWKSAFDHGETTGDIKPLLRAFFQAAGFKFLVVEIFALSVPMQKRVEGLLFELQRDGRKCHHMPSVGNDAIFRDARP